MPCNTPQTGNSIQHTCIALGKLILRDLIRTYRRLISRQQSTSTFRASRDMGAPLSSRRRQQPFILVRYDNTTRFPLSFVIGVTLNRVVRPPAVQRLPIRKKFEQTM